MLNIMEKTRKQIEGIRVKLTDLRAEQAWLKSALLPIDEVQDNLDSLVDSQASQKDIRAGLIQAYEDLFRVQAHECEGIVAVNTGPLLCVLFGAEIKQFLAKMAEQLDYEAGPPSAERPALSAEIDKQILELEKEEEKLLYDAEDAGFEVDRRADADPAVFLEFVA